MYARKVSARLRPNSVAKFAHLMESEILPWLRTQDGFLDLITLSAPDGSEVTTITFWEHKGGAQAYESCGYPEVLKNLAKLLDSAPYVKTFDVVNCTFPSSSAMQFRDPEKQDRGSESLRYRSYETNA